MPIPACEAEEILESFHPLFWPAEAGQFIAVSTSPSAVAVSQDGSLVAAVNPDSDTTSLVDADTPEALREISVGDDPRTLAFTPDSQLLLVANHSSATLSLVPVGESDTVKDIAVGPMPYGVVTDGERAFVAEFALGNITIIDLSSKALVTRISVAGHPSVHRSGHCHRPGESIRDRRGIHRGGHQHIAVPGH